MAKNVSKDYGQYNVHETITLRYKCEDCNGVHEQKNPLRYFVLFKKNVRQISLVLRFIEDITKQLARNQANQNFSFPQNLNKFPPINPN